MGRLPVTRGTLAPLTPIRQRIARSVFWVAWSQGAFQVVSLAVTLMVARLLNPDDYGIMALAGVWTASVGLIVELGLGAAIVQFRDLEDSELNACFWLTVAVSGLAYLALYAAAPLIAAWFGNARLSSVLRAVGLTLPLAALRLVPESLLRKRLELDKVGIAYLVGGGINIPVVLGLAWAGAGVWALVASALVVPLVQCAMSFWFVRWWPGVRVESRRLRQILSYSSATLTSQLCWVAYAQADAVVLGKMSGDLVLGAYSMAKQLAMVPAEKISTAANYIATPSMAELQGNREAMRRFLLRETRLVAWVTFPLCLGLIVLARDIIRVTLTDKWMAAAPMLVVLSVHACVRSVTVLFPPVLMATYRPAFLLRYNLVLLAIMPLTFWAGAAAWGGLGVAAAWAVVYPMVMTWMVREALREVDLPWRVLLIEFRAPLASTGMMLLAMAMAHWTFGGLWDAGGFRLMVVASAGAGAYGLALFAFGGAVRGDLRTLVGWLLRPGRAAAGTE